MGNNLARRNTLDNAVDILNTRVIDFHRRRITNAADAIHDRDYVTLRQLLEILSGYTPGGGGSGRTHQFQTVNLTSTAQAIANVTVVDGDTLTFYLTIGIAGSYPSWGSNYENAPTAVASSAGLTAIVGFFGNGGKWKWDGRFVAGF